MKKAPKDEKFITFVYFNRRNLWHALRKGGIMLTFRVNYTTQDYDYTYEFAPPPKLKDNRS